MLMEQSMVLPHPQTFMDIKLMPAHSNLAQYRLTDLQVDLLLHILDQCDDLTTEEDNERRRIVKALQSGMLLPQAYDYSREDPYANFCDI